MMRLTVTVSLLVCCWLSATAVGSVDQETDVIKRPRLDDRTYRVFTLANGIRAVAVNDPSATRAAYACAVNVGSHDDGDIDGLAHFSEHMAFLGSAAYPKPSEDDEFLTRAGGQGNAFTDKERTVFFAQLEATAFPEGLQRFAGFFASPLLDAREAHSEVQAVDSEHKKNMPSVDAQVEYLLMSLASGPLGHFATGSVDTLETEPAQRGVDMGAALKRFHSRFYCGHRMTVSTISPISLAEQQQLINDTFGVVSPTNEGICENTQDDFTRRSGGYDSPFDGTNTNQLIHLPVTENEHPLLFVSFALPPLREVSSSQPHPALRYLMEHKGRGGLFASLREEDLVSSVEYGAEQSSVADMALIRMELTGKGSKDVPRVLDRLFGYLNALRESDLNEVYASLARMSSVDFAWTDKSTDMSGDAWRLTESLSYPHVPPSDLLADVHGLMDVPDTELLMDVLHTHMTPEKANIAFADREFRCDSLAALHDGPPLQTPKIDSDEAALRVSSLSRLYEYVLGDALDIDLADLRQCGATARVTYSHQRGWTFRFTAYALQMPHLVNATAKAFATAHTTAGDSSVSRALSALLSDLRDVNTGLAVQSAGEIAEAISVRQAFHRSELAAFLSGLSSAGEATQQMHQTIAQQMDRLYLEALSCGNLNEAESADVITAFAHTIGVSHPLAPADAAELAVAQLRGQHIRVEAWNPIQNDVNGASLLVYQYPYLGIEEGVHLSILSQLVHQSLYDTLRTQSQLGYIAGAHLVTRPPHWSEIASHSYCFRRHDLALAYLTNGVELADLLATYKILTRDDALGVKMHPRQIPAHDSGIGSGGVGLVRLGASPSSKLRGASSALPVRQQIDALHK
ncbi:unnamed protein product [Vitrella brassicaformis CCMP3155]|uniref:Peptidase M16 N-terminal domain-containing protein n=1 Tax=Vitrella brassicaformis (strain CCMP3155) TaxID=1169540 RepID=A0A0G4EAL6_VITBC|nr:unnamed protein product [Vitrella brassicaformis CCMP3155]|eukprot:CEL92678.1 unnamed protein product [Vitrella brassicaformis CCMP3155]